MSQDGDQDNNIVNYAHLIKDGIGFVNSTRKSLTLRNTIRKKCIEQKYGSLSKITLLIRNKKVDKKFDQFYFKVPLKFEDENNKKIFNTTNAFVNYLFKEKNHRFLLKGKGGIGKTTYLKSILNTVLHRIEKNETAKYPFFISLFDYDPEEDFSKFIFNKIFDKYEDERYNNNYSDFINLLIKGGYIFLLDGFDEIEKNKSSALSQIQKFSDNFTNNSIIISSRFGSYITSINGFDGIKLKKIRVENKPYAYKIPFDKLTPGSAEQFIQFYAYKKVISKREAMIAISSFSRRQGFSLGKMSLNNPVLLFLYIWAIQDSNTLKYSLVGFYDAAIEYWLHLHDKYTKDPKFTRYIASYTGKNEIGYLKKILGKIGTRMFLDDVVNLNEKQILDHLIRYLDFDEEPEEFLKELWDSYPIIEKNDREYSFYDKKAQLYLSAKYLLSRQQVEIDDFISNYLVQKENYKGSLSIYFDTLKYYSKEKTLSIIYKRITYPKLLNDDYFLTLLEFFSYGIILYSNSDYSHVIDFNVTNVDNNLNSLYYSSYFNSFNYALMDVINKNMSLFDNRKSIIVNSDLYQKNIAYFNMHNIEDSYTKDNRSLQKYCERIYTSLVKNYHEDINYIERLNNNIESHEILGV